MVEQGVPAPELLPLAETVARGRLAFARGRYGEAADLYRAAISIEEKLPYMEPPFWYYPVKQSLGAALYRAGKYDAAREAFTGALAQTPNNGWALFGLAVGRARAGAARPCGGGAGGARPGVAGQSQVAADRAAVAVRHEDGVDRLGGHFGIIERVMEAAAFVAA